MRVLLDTNIIIHREASKIINQDIGILFNWLDRLHYEKCVHPLTAEELARNINVTVAQTMQVKLANYILLRTEAPLNEKVKQVSKELDKTDNDINDTRLLNEVFCERVDLLISEDNKIHLKAEKLGLTDSVFRIDSFLEKVASENPNLIDYKVLAVRKVYFGNVNIADSFFESFREDYKEFNRWFNKNSDKECYVCLQSSTVCAFLYLKIEDETENYSDINPIFPQKKRLKIGTFKVASNGFRLGERFLKIIFDNALQYKVDEIYVTLFDKRPEQEKLVALLQEWGFVYHGEKLSSNGTENVYKREFGKNLPINIKDPKLTFPFFSRESGIYIIKIEPQYHTELFPDSRLTIEPANKYTENEPYRNSIRKVYISHSPDRYLKTGDVILIYRIGESSPKKYSSTITTICIVESIVDNINTYDELKNICRKRTVITEEELRIKFWDKYPKYRPFVINLLYAHSFPTPKPTVNDLINLRILPDIMSIPKGFIALSKQQLDILLKFVYNK